MGRLLFACALAMLAPVPAAAQPGAPVSKPADPALFEAAMAVFEHIDLEAQVEQSLLLTLEDEMAAQQRMLAEGGLDMPADLMERLHAILRSEVGAMAKEIMPSFRAEAAAIYAAHFTLEELRELARLMQNPVMRKLEGMAPVIAVEMSRIGRRAAEARGPALVGRLERMLEEWMAEQQMTGGVIEQ